MNITTISKATITHEASWMDARISKVITNNNALVYQLDNGDYSRHSTGCLLEPEQGDLVLIYHSDTGDNYITQVLEKKQHQNGRINIKGVRQLSIEHDGINILANNKISMTCFADIDINAIAGNLTMQVNNLISSVRETIVETTRHRIAKAFTYALDVTGLLRIQSEQGILMAEKDLKIDAERINVG